MIDMANSILFRLSSVMVEGNTLNAVRSFDWGTTDPYVSLPIPGGSVSVKQDIIPAEVTGVIVMYDATSLWTAFYGGSVPIIDELTSVRRVFSTDGQGFMVTYKDTSGEYIYFSFYNVRINTIQLVGPVLEGGNEGAWQIRFMASRVVRL
jgi:hypothetical protein